ncbi:MAG TPA: PASTA domain-containing protein, partial [Saprospiraceae bacterium]|nr:PASTA domain-containing protein [Saprospiraceae bacterium]
SKYAAETLLSEQLPVLYGKKYEHKKVELFNTFELYTRITGVQFDPGPENHILQVSYKGRLIINDQERTAGVPIARGDTLEIVISTKKGGAVPVPDLVCKTLAEARFLLESSKLELGAIREEGEITDAASAYVIEQFPPAQSEETVDLGTAFKITIAQERPAHCDPQ